MKLETSPVEPASTGQAPLQKPTHIKIRDIALTITAVLAAISSVTAAAIIISPWIFSLFLSFFLAWGVWVLIKLDKKPEILTACKVNMMTAFLLTILGLLLFSTVPVELSAYNQYSIYENKKNITNTQILLINTLDGEKKPLLKPSPELHDMKDRHKLGYVTPGFRSSPLIHILLIATSTLIWGASFMMLLYREIWNPFNKFRNVLEVAFKPNTKDLPVSKYEHKIEIIDPAE